MEQRISTRRSGPNSAVAPAARPRSNTPAGDAMHGEQEPSPRARDCATGLAICLLALAAANAEGQTLRQEGASNPQTDMVYDRLGTAFCVIAPTGTCRLATELARQYETQLTSPLLSHRTSPPPRPDSLEPEWACGGALFAVPGGDGPGSAAMSGSRVDCVDGYPPRSPNFEAWENPFDANAPVALEIRSALRISSGLLHATSGIEGFLARAFVAAPSHPAGRAVRDSVLPAVREELLQSSQAVLALSVSTR